MKLKISKKALLQGINIAEKAVSSKILHQALACFSLEVEDNLCLKSMNNEIAVKTELDCEVYEKGSILVNASLFSDIIRKLGDEDVNIQTNDKTIFINSAQSNFRLQIEDLEFPDFPYCDDKTEFKINSGDLRKAIQSCMVSVVEDDLRPELRGILFEIEKEHINFVSLDGYRLSLVSYEREFNHPSLPMRLIVPGSNCKELIKILPEDEDISLIPSDDGIFFKFNNTLFFSKLIAGNYFDYRKMIDRESPIKIIAEVKDFRASLERAMILKKEGSQQGVILNFDDNEMTFETNSETGDFKETLKVEGNGSGLKIKFNTRYLLSGISQFSSDKISLLLDGPLRPMIIKDKDGIELYLVLPTRI